MQNYSVKFKTCWPQKSTKDTKYLATENTEGTEKKNSKQKIVNSKLYGRSQKSECRMSNIQCRSMIYEM